MGTWLNCIVEEISTRPLGELESSLLAAPCASSGGQRLLARLRSVSKLRSRISINILCYSSRKLRWPHNRSPASAKRACRDQLRDVLPQLRKIISADCEVAVHGTERRRSAPTRVSLNANKWRKPSVAANLACGCTRRSRSFSALLDSGGIYVRRNSRLR